MRTWVRLYTEINRDPKMGRLTDRQFRVCISLFALAGDIDRDGEIGNLEDVAWQLRDNATSLQDDLRALSEVGIIAESDGIWRVVNFVRRNPIAPSAEPEAVRERVARHRRRKRASSKTAGGEPSNEDVTRLHQDGNEDVTRLEKIRIDKNREEEKEKIRGGADAPPPEPPPPPQPSTEKTTTRAPSPKDTTRRALQEHFTAVTGLSPPPESSKAAGAAWYAPLRNIAEMTSWDTEAGKALVSEAVARLDGEGLTIADPRSILKTAAAIQGEKRRGAMGARASPTRNGTTQDGRPAAAATQAAWRKQKGLKSGEP